MRGKRPKIRCEIESCDVTDPSLLERHHIVERTELHMDNDDMNLAVLCCNHHKLIDSGRLKIIGVFPGTRPPTGRILVYVLDGVCNFPGLENEKPYYTPQPKSMKLFNKTEK